MVDEGELEGSKNSSKWKSTTAQASQNTHTHYTHTHTERIKNVKQIKEVAEPLHERKCGIYFVA